MRARRGCLTRSMHGASQVAAKTCFALMTVAGTLPLEVETPDSSSSYGKLINLNHHLCQF